MPAALLPEGTRLNTNGAGDAYTSGLLVASMLRHTGNVLSKPSVADESSLKKDDVSPSKARGSGGKKMTPYTLYMRENYVTLKQQCMDDKKAMFARCHEMWENESDEVKGMYERMVKEEYGDLNETGSEALSDTSLEGLDVSALTSSTGGSGDVQFNIDHSENASLNLESAIQFAGLVAAFHVDTTTRDLNSLDLGSLLEAAIVSLSATEPNEI